MRLRLVSFIVLLHLVVPHQPSRIMRWRSMSLISNRHWTPTGNLVFAHMRYIVVSTVIF